MSAVLVLAVGVVTLLAQLGVFAVGYRAMVRMAGARHCRGVVEVGAFTFMVLIGIIALFLVYALAGVPAG